MSYKILYTMEGKELDFDNLLTTWKKFASQYNIAWKDSFLQWELPSNIPADFALTLALPISYKTKKNPQEIAREIVKMTTFLELEYIITAQGYINFRFPISYYHQFFTETFFQKGKNLQGKKKNVRINIEYVSANPTGYLHLAHFRHAVIGNTLANVYQFCGYKVIREYYVNDKGKQILSLIVSVFYFYCKLGEWPLPEGAKAEYLGKSSEDVAKKLLEKWGDKLYKVYKNSEDENFFNVWGKEIFESILDKIQQDLEKFGIKFDKWFLETDLYKNDNNLKLLSELEEKKLVDDREGAKFFRSSLGGDDKDRVIIKQDGDYTYFFSDILYHQNKLTRADKIINIWGADHHGYVARIKSVCQLLGYKPENIQIVLVQIVNLLTKEGKTKRFSKRAGNTIELDEALQYVDMDQLKFFLLEKEPNQPLSINTELLKENKEKTRLYYIQYAHARCHQIFQKAQTKGIAKIGGNVDLLNSQIEREIFNSLIRFSFVLEKIIEENKSHHLINYLYELSRAWQVYYQNSIILEPENPELTSQKLLLVKNIQIILKLGLGLMGITAPSRM